MQQLWQDKLTRQLEQCVGLEQTLAVCREQVCGLEKDKEELLQSLGELMSSKAGVEEGVRRVLQENAALHKALEASTRPTMQ